MESDKYKIVVIVLNYNSWQASSDYIHLMQNQKVVNLKFLVVDNCSPDGSYDKLITLFPGNKEVEIIKSEYNGGYAYGNNFGLHYIKDKTDDNTFVLISNNDIVVENPLLLQSLCETYQECKNIAFISPLMHIDKQPAGNCAWKIPDLKYDICTVVGFNRDKENKSVYYDLPQHSETPKEVDCLTGAFFMGKLSTFKLLNYFDERTFLYEEERILAYKAKNAGLSNYLALNLQFDHIHSAVISKELDSFYRIKHLLNSRVVCHKYYANTNKLKVALLKLVYSLYIFVKRIQYVTTPNKTV